MVHGDDSGLVLPPAVAPIQLIIVPIAQHKEGVIEKATEIKNKLSKLVRVKMDISDKMAGWKFSQYEMKGVPLRLEVGPKDIEKNQVVLVRRDTREKIIVAMSDLEIKVPEILNDIQKSLLEKARTIQNNRTFSVNTVEELKELLDKTLGFVDAPWCGELVCEEKVKEVAGASSRCMPLDQPDQKGVCLCCGKPAKAIVTWGRAY
jgi:prolyl-tRNA synthetase